MNQDGQAYYKEDKGADCEHSLGMAELAGGETPEQAERTRRVVSALESDALLWQVMPAPKPVI